jgi:holin-like protein
MKYLKQLLIIVAVAFVGEVLNHFIPLAVPASIYGIIILFALLETGLLKLSAIRETAAFLVEIMPVLFIPSAIGLIESWGIIRTNLAAFLVMTVVSLLTVMLVSGRVTQAIIRAGRRKEDAHG